MSEAICKKCRWLRETTGRDLDAHYKACGWPLPPLPNVMLRHSVSFAASEANRLIPHKVLNEMGHLLSECQTFEPSAEDTHE